MKQYSFATLVTATAARPNANHLPLVISQQDDQLLITGHFSKANEQWQQIGDGPVLAIFSEPHAYISPGLYEKEQNVPTWNYVAVHAYGNARIVEAEQEKRAMLAQMIDQFEPGYQQQWQHLDEAYQAKMLNGIVAFEITVTELLAKEKLSQNRTDAERQRIADSLLQSDYSYERAAGRMMQRAHDSRP